MDSLEKYHQPSSIERLQQLNESNIKRLNSRLNNSNLSLNNLILPPISSFDNLVRAAEKQYNVKSSLSTNNNLLHNSNKMFNTTTLMNNNINNGIENNTTTTTTTNNNDNNKNKNNIPANHKASSCLSSSRSSSNNNFSTLLPNISSNSISNNSNDTSPLLKPLNSNINLNSLSNNITPIHTNNNTNSNTPVTTNNNTASSSVLSSPLQSPMDLLHNNNSTNTLSSNNSGNDNDSNNDLNLKIDNNNTNHGNSNKDNFSIPSSENNNSKKIVKPRRKKQCPICFNFYANLSTHKSTHLTPEDRPHRCKICQREFARNNDLIRHQKRHWKDDNLNDDNLNDHDKLISLHNIKGTYKCPFNSTLIQLDMEIYPYKSKPLFFETSNCHSTGVFSRCDTFKNHLKALHFEYPPGTKKRERSVVPGRCRNCGIKFDNVDIWLNEHVGKKCGYTYH